MSNTTPPQTPAAGDSLTLANSVKQEADEDAMVMDNTPKQSKFTPLSRITDSSLASDVHEDSEPKTPTKATPKKRSSTAVKDGAEGAPSKKRSPPKPKAAKEPKTPKEKAPKEKASKGGAAKGAARPIPLSFEEADEADRLLVEMKNRGAAWKDIKEMWIEKTGQTPGGSTLSGRYSRIKDNLMHLKPGEAEYLREAIKEVESRFQSEKWSLVANEMKKRGCEAYSTSFLQKQLKVIEDSIAKGTYVVVAVPTENGINGDAETDEEESGDVENEQDDGNEGDEGEEEVKAEDAED